MSELEKLLETYFNPFVYKAVLSGPLAGASIEKLVIDKLESGYQIQRHAPGKIYHENAGYEAALNAVLEALSGVFRQYNSWDGKYEYMIKISKKGKILHNKAPGSASPDKREAHNREKSYIIPEGSPVLPLIELGVFTKDGRIVKSMYSKYRQINRFLEMVGDGLRDWDSSKTMTVLDFGCGKSYLTFVLYHYLTVIKGYRVKMTGLDLKEDVINKCRETAERFGHDGLTFEVGDIGGYKSSKHVDVVVALHACDTATDYALKNAVDMGAGFIFSVPCCQHELNNQVKSDNFPILTHYGIIKERIAALMTDALRANLLTCCGYRTQVLEFVDLSHTAKNLMLRAVKGGVSQAARGTALEEVRSLCGEFGLSPALLNLLGDHLNNI